MLISAFTLTAGFLDHRPDFPLFDSGDHSLLADIMTTADLVVGPAHDTLLIDSNYSQFGNLIVIGNGTVIIDDAELCLYGVLWQQDSSTVIVRNDGYLHVMQEYLSQYPHNMEGDSRFEATDATVYANTTYRTFLNDNSTYIARRTHFPFWNFRECYDNSSLILEDANMVGDILVEDSCFVSFTRCDTILPWFGAGDGAIIDIEFPDYDSIEHYEFDSTQPGISGVKYSAVFDSCSMFMPGICPAVGCSVIIRNSVFCAALRVSGSDTLYFNGVSNRKFYIDFTMPFHDRHFRLVDSYTQLWCIYTYDDVVLHMDSCFWGESHAKDNSTIFAEACSTNGFPSSVTSTENGYFSFIDGKVTAFISSWFNATTYIENSIVTPTRPGIAQRSNIAHHHSKMLCVNTVFDTLPFAMDTAIVIFAFLDSLDTVATCEEIPITGSAWVDVGPECVDDFEGYSVFYFDGGGETEICGSIEEVFDDTLAIWNTEGIEGDCEIRLEVRTTEGETLRAKRDVLVVSMAVKEVITPDNFTISAYPNPFNSAVTIAFDCHSREGGNPEGITVEIYDVNGRCVETVTEPVEVTIGVEATVGRLAKDTSTSSVSVKSPLSKGDLGGFVVWQPAPSLGSGVYLVRASVGNESTSKRIVYLK